MTTTGPDRTQRARTQSRGDMLGDLLLREGLVGEEDLADALAAQRASGERLGRILMNRGLVRRIDMGQALAHQWGWEFCDLQVTPCDPALATRGNPEEYTREGWFPVSERDGTVTIAVSDRPTKGRVRRWAAELGAERIYMVATTDWDIQEAICRTFADTLAHDAAFALTERDPRLSALSGFATWHKLAAGAAIGLIGAALWLWPWMTLAAVLAVGSAIFTVAIAFKLIVTVAGVSVVRRSEREARERTSGPRIPDHELPTYTILVPVYKESNIIAGLIDHLGALDYPREKLEILLLMEEDDEETLAAARAAHPPEMIRFVVIPDGAPKTKPRACNVGLFFARGEFLVIYDAEDRPEPGQLRDAVAGFRATGPETICLQARLNYFNARENLLTRMFTLEYSYWFDYMLPGLDRLRLPLPLGGTSNHFRTEPLRKLSGWDAWNVTEDADLGLRAGAEGYRVGVIDSTTYEEACSRLRPWIRQRTRWIKGYMQTAVVHTRNPWRFTRSCGARGLVTLALLVAGTPLVFMAAPVMWLLSLAWLLLAVFQFGASDVLPGEIEIVGLLNLVIGNGLIVALHALAVGRRKLWWLLPFALLAPLYWLLHSFASWRAAVQLLHNPFYWEKTPHGLGESAPEGGLPVPAEVTG
jgi:cellulose synthase/poly-beta-1,6-N-acetylglucosamine synthase-like glycosyltransferase